jgi:hypothetical protein
LTQFTVYSGPGDFSFDGEVQFKIQGPDGNAPDTDSLSLGTGDGSLFAAGGVDVVTVRGRDIGGAPTKLFGNINYRNNYSSYVLSRVDVLNKSTGDKYTFKLGGNLYTWNWWTEISALPLVDYLISTNTGNTSKGFDGNVYITIAGDDGNAVDGLETRQRDVTGRNNAHRELPRRRARGD